MGKPLVESLAGRPLDRLQVLVDERSDFFPLELVYDLPAPAKDATLCAGWKTALRTGTCDKQHDATDGQLHPKTFCPSGFWGLSKVIERRVVGDGGWAEPAPPKASRSPFAWIRPPSATRSSPRARCSSPPAARSTT